MNRKGAEGGIWKLIAIIIGVAILVLLVVGLTTGFFDPALEKLNAGFDKAFTFIFGDWFDSGNDLEPDDPSNEYQITPDIKGKFYIERDGCKVDTDVGGYKVMFGDREFYKWDGSKWVRHRVLTRDENLIKDFIEEKCK